jgi:hypothetical protein
MERATRFVPLAKGQYDAGSLEKAAGTVIGTAKARACTSAGTHTTAQWTIKDQRIRDCPELFP